MAKIIKVRLTEYFPSQSGLSDREKKLEGGSVDRMGIPLHSLEDYIEGKAPYVSLACDSAGGPPANADEFRIYGFRVFIPFLATEINKFIDKPVMLPIMIEFRLVDTGGAFTGKKKQVIVPGVEPIDVCRRARPELSKSFSETVTEMHLLGKP